MDTPITGTLTLVDETVDTLSEALTSTDNQTHETVTAEVAPSTTVSKTPPESAFVPSPEPEYLNRFSRNALVESAQLAADFKVAYEKQEREDAKGLAKAFIASLSTGRSIPGCMVAVHFTSGKSGITTYTVGESGDHRMNLYLGEMDLPFQSIFEAIVKEWISHYTAVRDLTSRKGVDLAYGYVLRRIQQWYDPIVSKQA